MSESILLVAVDQGVDLKKLRALQKVGKIRLQQVRDIEVSWKNVADHGQPFTIGASIIGGPDMIAGDNVNEVRALFRKDQENDFRHVYSAHLVQADYFVTGDKTDFIVNGRRERMEGLMPGLKVRTTAEFLEEIGAET